MDFGSSMTSASYRRSTSGGSCSIFQGVRHRPRRRGGAAASGVSRADRKAARLSATSRPSSGKRPGGAAAAVAAVARRPGSVALKWRCARRAPRGSSWRSGGSTFRRRRGGSSSRSERKTSTSRCITTPAMPVSAISPSRVSRRRAPRRASRSASSSSCPASRRPPAAAAGIGRSPRATRRTPGREPHVNLPLRDVRVAQHRIYRRPVGGVELVADSKVPDGANTPAGRNAAGHESSFPDT